MDVNCNHLYSDVNIKVYLLHCFDFIYLPEYKRLWYKSEDKNDQRH